MEHKRWCAERWLAGWQLGKERNNVKKIHNAIVTWEKLDDKNKGYCKDSIRLIPELFTVTKEI